MRFTSWGLRDSILPGGENNQTKLLVMGEGNDLGRLTVLVAQSCPTLATPWTVAHQAPLSMGFSRQEYWSGVPFPSPGNLPNIGIQPGTPALQQILYHLSHQGS